jgi:hypothetical protein
MQIRIKLHEGRLDDDLGSAQAGMSEFGFM